MQGVLVQSLVREPRPHTPFSQKIKTQNRSSIVTNPIKTSLKKWSTSKKKKKNLKKKVQIASHLDLEKEAEGQHFRQKENCSSESEQF